jgi:predicted Zn-dependent protease
MAGFFKTLDRLSGGAEGRLPDFLSTHPNPIDRYGKVRTNAGRFQNKKPGEYTINREGYLRLIDGIVYGPDPRQGFVENQMFYHPELKFQFPVPLSWKYVNSPQQFQMGSADQKALMILTLAQEKSLAEAARNFAEKNKLRQMDIRNTTINGLQAIVQLCDQVPQQPQQGQPQQQGQAQQPTVRIVTGFIMHDNLIYKLHGVAEVKDFANYDPIFSSVIKGFNVLTDPVRLGAKAEKIRIKTVQQTASFKDVMLGMGLPEKRVNELSIVNGMLPTDQVQAGTQIKMVEK